jgi:hypothetical protein
MLQTSTDLCLRYLLHHLISLPDRVRAFILTKGVAACDVAVGIGIHVGHERRLPAEVLQDLQSRFLLLIRGAVKLPLRGKYSC